MDLVFSGATVTGDRALDFRRGELVDLEVPFGKTGEQRASGLGEHDEGSNVDAVEEALEGYRVWGPAVEKYAELAAEKDEAIRQGYSSSARKTTVGQD